MPSPIVVFSGRGLALICVLTEKLFMSVFWVTAKPWTLLCVLFFWLAHRVCLFSYITLPGISHGWSKHFLKQLNYWLETFYFWMLALVVWGKKHLVNLNLVTNVLKMAITLSDLTILNKHSNHTNTETEKHRLKSFLIDTISHTSLSCDWRVWLNCIQIQSKRRDFDKFPYKNCNVVILGKEIMNYISSLKKLHC